VAIGDLNGDGRRDLAVANTNSNTVSVLFGHGDGTFEPRADFAAGKQPVSVAIGDLSGEGVPDVAVANAGSNTVSVLLGNGNGTFRPKTDLGTGSGPVAVAIGDLNGDGRSDLAVANFNSNTASALLQDVALAGVPPAPPASGIDLSIAPNPVSRELTLRFTAPSAGAARVELFDVSGRRMATLFDGALPAGPSTLRLAIGTGVTQTIRSGLYMVRATAPGYSAMRRVVIVR